MVSRLSITEPPRRSRKPVEQPSIGLCAKSQSDPAFPHIATEDRPLRVVLVISNLEYGGAQRQVVALANGLDHYGCETYICSLSSYVPLADGLRDRARLHLVEKRSKFDMRVVPTLARLLMRLRVDVVHGFLFDAEITVRLAGRLARTPLIVGSERNSEHVLLRRHLIAYRLTRGCVDMVVANSNAGAQYNRMVLGHPSERYRVVHNGVDVDRFCPGEGLASRRELGLGADDRVVGMFASFKRQKNHAHLLEAGKRIAVQVPSVKILLVGDELHAGLEGTDAYKRDILELTRRLGLESRCVFVGNRDDLERLYRACDVTVLPSSREGTPNVLLEAMACGIPVIASAISDNAQVVPNGHVGYTYPLGDVAALTDRILGILTDDDLRRKMGIAARKWVEREFSLDRLCQKTISVYRTALARKMGRPVHDSIDGQCVPTR